MSSHAAWDRPAEARGQPLEQDARLEGPLEVKPWVWRRRRRFRDQ